MSGTGPIGSAAATTASEVRRPIEPSRTGVVSGSEEPDAWAVLASVHGLGPVGFSALLRRYGSGLAILREAATPGGADRLAETPVAWAGDDPTHGPRVLPAAIATAIARASQLAEETLAGIRDLGLTVVTLEDPGYPSRLAAIEMPPHVLFVMGDPAALDDRPAVAIVGTRRATDAGRVLASRIATALAAVGATVVSGLAYGIDGAAHAATVAAGGTTVAVIGSGHADIQPAAHGRLAASIVASGGVVVSELAPTIQASRGTFPRRNRIISGLTEATVVVEAPARSGALITASWALEQGRECFLVPGPIGARASEGCLAFLREFPGTARIVAGVPQLIEDLGLADRSTEAGVSALAAASLADVGAVPGRIGRELVLGHATVDELMATTGWPVATVLAALTLLERDGLAVGVHGRYRPAGTLAAVDPGTVRAPDHGPD